MDFFKIFAKNYPQGFGSFLAIIGVLILTPDTMVMRFSNLERWELMGCRGILMGVTLFFIWYFFFKSGPIKKLSSIYNLNGLIFVLVFSANSIFFTLGIIETSVMVVLTAVATMPVFAALLSIVMMKESQSFVGWITIITAMVGVFIVVSDGNNAVGKPEGSVIIGAIYGLGTAICLALNFTMVRKFPELEVMPASAIGAFLRGVIGFAFSSDLNFYKGPIWTLISKGSVILPISFTLLLISAKYTSSAVVSLIMLLEMVIGPFWVWLGVGEKPSFVMISGAFLVLIAIIFHITFAKFNQTE